mgnify:CR=1 FL=1
MKCNQICKWNSNAGCVKPYGVPCILENVSQTDKKATNADRIRAMSDEELAKLIVKHKPLYSWCKGVREIWMKPNVTKVQAWLEWLQQPAE